MAAALEPRPVVTVRDGDDLMILIGEYLVGPQDDIESGDGDADVVLAEELRSELLQIAAHSPDHFSYAVAELLNSAFKMSAAAINEPDDSPKARRQIRELLGRLRLEMRSVVADAKNERQE